MWLIFGGNGWIGKQFQEELDHQEIPYQLSQYRMDVDPTLIEEEIIQKGVDRVVCLAGRTSGGAYNTIDYLEGGKQQNYENVRDNLFGPIQLAIVSKKRGIHFTYLGTGCIFNYDAQHTTQNEYGFKETDAPNFFGSSYSIVKGFTDRLFHLNDTFHNTLNLRIRMPINEDLASTRNFITKITSYKKICSIKNSMTVIPDVLPIMVDMIKKQKTGTVNLVNPGVISHNEILDMYKSIIDPAFTYENFTLEEQGKILKSDRSNNKLDTTELENEYFILPIYESVQRLLKRVKKHKIMSLKPTMKNVLVTGGFGFIGSNFIHLLYRQYPDIKVVNVDKVSDCSRREHLKGLKDVVSYENDINEMETMLEILETHTIDVVVHFAAESHVDKSFDNSIQFTQANVSGTHNLLEACKRYGQLSRFIHISTDEVYGETMGNIPFTEKHNLNPTNPYAATKISAEFIVQSYFHCFELPIVIVRGNNVFGPNQHVEKVIPKFITALLNNKKCAIHGRGNTKRNFIFVEDMCRCILHVIEKGEISQIYNIGTNHEYSVLQIADKLIYNIKGSHVDPKDYYEYVEDRYYNDFQYRIDASKVKKLGWKNETSFEEGLQKCIGYYSGPENAFREHM
jgi:dTDP-glucose 4,6-dehydratase